MSDRRTLSSREVQVDTDIADLTYMSHQIDTHLHPNDTVPSYAGLTKATLKKYLMDRISLITWKYRDAKDDAMMYAREIGVLGSKIKTLEMTNRKFNMATRACRMALGHSVSSDVNRCSNDARDSLRQAIENGVYGASGFNVKDGRVTVDMSISDFMELSCVHMQHFADRAFAKASDIVDDEG